MSYRVLNSSSHVIAKRDGHDQAGYDYHAKQEDCHIFTWCPIAAFLATTPKSIVVNCTCLSSTPERPKRWIGVGRFRGRSLPTVITIVCRSTYLEPLERQRLLVVLSYRSLKGLWPR